MAHGVCVRVVSLLVVALVAACAKEDKSVPTASKTVEAGAAVSGPKNLDLAKAALVSAKAKHVKHETVETDCAPIRSLEADFADDKSPDVLKTRREIAVFCEIDVKLEGSVATLKGDQDKLTAAQKKKDRAGEQMYAATLKDGCASVRQQLESLATDKLDGEPKMAGLKADIERICAPAAAKKN